MDNVDIEYRLIMLPALDEVERQEFEIELDKIWDSLPLSEKARLIIGA